MFAYCLNRIMATRSTSDGRYDIRLRKGGMDGVEILLYPWTS